jgi:hypothetical protein
MMIKIMGISCYVVAAIYQFHLTTGASQKARNRAT